MKYVVYNPSSGEIVISGECSVPDDHEMGTILEDADGSSATHYVKNGVLTAYTTDQVTSKSNVPTYPATWSNTSFSWVDSRTLSQAQADTWETIKADRGIAQLAGFTWNGYKFDSDDISIQRIQGAVQLAVLAQAAGSPFSIVWTLYDNTTLTMSGSDIINMYLSLGSFIQGIFATGVTLRNQINSATSISQLYSITWPTTS